MTAPAQKGLRRNYRSPARAEQADRTKTSIVEAMARQLFDTGSSAISVPQAADAAGVAIRTVYHYFPDEAARVMALVVWIDERLRTEAPLPSAAEELPEYARNRVAHIGTYLPYLRAQHALGDTTLRAIRTRRRTTLVKTLLRETENPPRDLARVAETISFLLSGTTARSLIDEHGLSASNAGETIARLIETILASP